MSCHEHEQIASVCLTSRRTIGTKHIHVKYSEGWARVKELGVLHGVAAVSQELHEELRCVFCALRRATCQQLKQFMPPLHVIAVPCHVDVMHVTCIRAMHVMCHAMAASCRMSCHACRHRVLLCCQ